MPIDNYTPAHFARHHEEIVKALIGVYFNPPYDWPASQVSRALPGLSGCSRF